MKSFFTYLAVASSFAPLAFAAPASDNALVERALSPADEPAALARMETLFTTVTKYTAVINSTAKSLTSASTAAQNNTAGMTFKSNIASINSAVVAATKDVKALGGSKHHHERDVAIEERQAAGGLPAELALIIMEIGGALNMIIATLGLSMLTLIPINEELC
jgi:protein subunit release factor A